MKRTVVIVLGVLAVVVLAYVGGSYVLVRAALWSRSSRPLPAGTVLADARAKASRQVAREFEAIDRHCARSAIAYYDSGMQDYCLVGHHNWQVDAVFNNRCRYVVLKYYGFDGDFRVAMSQLDTALVASGWARYGGGLQSMLAGYYDRWYGPDKPKPQNFPRQYLVQNIPASSYTRDSLRLFVRYEEADSTGKAFVLRFEDMATMMERDLSHRDVRGPDASRLAATILEKNRYVLVIGIMAEDYFVN